MCVCSYRFVSVKMMARRHKNYAASIKQVQSRLQRLIDRSYTDTLASQIFQTYRSPSPSILSLLNTWLASLEEIARKQIRWPWWWQDWRTDGLDIGDNRTWEQCCIDSEEDAVNKKRCGHEERQQEWTDVKLQYLLQLRHSIVTCVHTHDERWGEQWESW